MHYFSLVSFTQFETIFVSGITDEQRAILKIQIQQYRNMFPIAFQPPARNMSLSKPPPPYPYKDSTCGIAATNIIDKRSTNNPASNNDNSLRSSNIQNVSSASKLDIFYPSFSNNGILKQLLFDRQSLCGKNQPRSSSIIPAQPNVPLQNTSQRSLRILSDVVINPGASPKQVQNCDNFKIRLPLSQPYDSQIANFNNICNDINSKVSRSSSNLLRTVLQHSQNNFIETGRVASTVSGVQKKSNEISQKSSSPKSTQLEEVDKKISRSTTYYSPVNTVFKTPNPVAQLRTNACNNSSGVILKNNTEDNFIINALMRQQNQLSKAPQRTVVSESADSRSVLMNTNHTNSPLQCLSSNEKFSPNVSPFHTLNSSGVPLQKQNPNISIPYPHNNTANTTIRNPSISIPCYGSSPTTSTDITPSSPVGTSTASVVILPPCPADIIPTSPTEIRSVSPAQTIALSPATSTANSPSVTPTDTRSERTPSSQAAATPSSQTGSTPEHLLPPALRHIKSPVYAPMLFSPTLFEEMDDSESDTAENEVIDLTWIDDLDPQQLQTEMNEFFVKKEEFNEEVILNQEQFPVVSDLKNFNQVTAIACHL